MPIYEYRCKKCEAEFEMLRPMGDTGKSLKCPECGAAAPEKKLSVFAASSSASDSALPCASGASCGGGGSFG